MTFYRTPFHLLDNFSQVPIGAQVVVVSDQMYKEHKQKQAQKEIDILTSRAASYRNTADLIEDEILNLQKEAGLLPSAEETSEWTASRT